MVVLRVLLLVLLPFILELIQLMFPNGRRSYPRDAQFHWKRGIFEVKKYKRVFYSVGKRPRTRKTRNELFLFISAYIFYHVFCRFSHLGGFSYENLTFTHIQRKNRSLTKLKISVSTQMSPSSSTATHGKVYPQNKLCGPFISAE